MNRAQDLELFTQSKSILAARYGVADLALFGSAAHDAALMDNGIDILAAFDGPATSARHIGVHFEDLFGRAVDLVTDNALRAELRTFIEREAIHV